LGKAYTYLRRNFDIVAGEFIGFHSSVPTVTY